MKKVVFHSNDFKYHSFQSIMIHCGVWLGQLFRFVTLSHHGYENDDCSTSAMNILYEIVYLLSLIDACYYRIMKFVSGKM